ncbi:MAG: adenylate/guanylate cyclase domain-containing protein [Actinomycetota bacterium]
MTEWEAAERTEGLPRGTVTLLFTDIEGSTRRWQEYGEEMRRAVGVHDDIHRRAIEAEGGVVVKHTGDGFMAAFADADSAVRAAVVTQRALSDRTWDPLPPLRVRMGLHTGAVHPTGRDYFGPVVNRAARVGDVGHGGQIIVSAATAALLDPTDEIELRSRGLTRLKDLGEPVELFQVLAPGLDHEAVPLRALADPGGVFPTSASSFVGRTQELRTISALLDEQRLVSVVGPGGVGKSRLSIQAAAEVADRFGDGVVFIELAAAEAGRTSAVVRDQLAASPAVAHPPVDDDPQQAVVRSLGRSEVLMVIDNCEHVVEDVALLVDAVLGACPSTRVLVTSRGPLHLRGESVVQLQTLPVDDAGGPARDLFLERSSDAGVAIDDADTMDDIDRICRLVDGLPLAIELAAAQVVHITPAELARRLERHQAGLVAHDPTVPERHRTIDQLLQWSEDLIDDDALELLLRMSVSAGPMPLATIEGAFADDDGVVRREDVVRLLGALIGQSLVELRRDDGTYGMLGMVRSYCRQQLVEPHAWQRRLTEWCAEALSDAVATDQEDGLAQTMGQVGREVLAGFEWALDEGDGELACRIGAALWPWYEMAGRVGDGRAALGRAVELGTSDAATLGRAYSGAGSLAIAVGDAVDALALHRKAV